MPTQVERNQRALKRWRMGLLAAFILLPAALFLLFARQTKRLTDLAEAGEVTTAIVDHHTRQEGQVYTHYRYEVNGVSYTWSTGYQDAPVEPGNRLAILYAPRYPSLSRPYVDRSRAHAEVDEQVRFATKAVFVLAYAIAIFALGVQLQLQRLKRYGQNELSDPNAPKRRLAFLTTTLIVPAFVGITSFHWQDAAAKGQSTIPVALSALLVVSVGLGTVWYLTRQGHEESRRQKLMRVVAPLAFWMALLRLLLHFYER